ncbi:MAG: diguanylate cyclase [Fimbriimonadaceae bacterium]
MDWFTDTDEEETTGGEKIAVVVHGFSDEMVGWLRHALSRKDVHLSSTSDGVDLKSAVASQGAQVVAALFDEVGEPELAEVASLRHDYPTCCFLAVLGEPRSSAVHDLAYATGIDEFVPAPFHPFEVLAKIRTGVRVAGLEASLRDLERQHERAREDWEKREKVFRTASNRFEELFHGLPVACFTLDQFGKIQEWNALSVALFQIDSFLAFDHSPSEIFGQGTDFWTDERLEFVLAGGRLIEEQWTFTPRSGETQYLVSNVLPLTGPSGSTVGSIVATVDVTDRTLAEQRIAEQKRELEALNNRLERLALTDGLTGLFNHRRFQELLEITLETSDKQVSLILIDVDHFKMFNDTYGHQEGDQVLRTVARLIESATPENGAAARYGGEEFAVILDGAGKQKAMRVAEQIRAKIQGYGWQRRPVTVSVGVSTTGRVPISSSELVSGADQALYASKHAGRNRVTHFRDLLAPETPSRAAA